MNKRIELYKDINDEIVLVDYGVESQIDSYTAQGYIVSIVYTYERKHIL